MRMGETQNLLEHKLEDDRDEQKERGNEDNKEKEVTHGNAGDMFA